MADSLGGKSNSNNEGSKSPNNVDDLLAQKVAAVTAKWASSRGTHQRRLVGPRNPRRMRPGRKTNSTNNGSTNTNTTCSNNCNGKVNTNANANASASANADADANANANDDVTNTKATPATAKRVGPRKRDEGRGAVKVCVGPEAAGNARSRRSPANGTRQQQQQSQRQPDNEIHQQQQQQQPARRRRPREQESSSEDHPAVPVEGPQLAGATTTKQQGLNCAPIYQASQSEDDETERGDVRKQSSPDIKSSNKVVAVDRKSDDGVSSNSDDEDFVVDASLPHGQTFRELERRDFFDEKSVDFINSVLSIGGNNNEDQLLVDLEFDLDAIDAGPCKNIHSSSDDDDDDDDNSNNNNNNAALTRAAQSSNGRRTKSESAAKAPAMGLHSRRTGPRKRLGFVADDTGAVKSQWRLEEPAVDANADGVIDTRTHANDDVASRRGDGFSSSNNSSNDNDNDIRSEDTDDSWPHRSKFGWRFDASSFPLLDGIVFVVPSDKRMQVQQCVTGSSLDCMFA